MFTEINMKQMRARTVVVCAQLSDFEVRFLNILGGCDGM